MQGAIHSENSLGFLGWQLLGGLILFVWSAAVSNVFFFSANYLGFLRFSHEEEMKGLDMIEHDGPAYKWKWSDLEGLPLINPEDKKDKKEKTKIELVDI